MNLKLYALVLATALSSHSFSQQKNQFVMASAGEISGSKSVVLEWTLGEFVVESFKTPYALYTQGFHQPVIEVINNDHKILGKDQVKNFRVFPNPTSSSLNVMFEKVTDVPFSLSLVDVNGIMLLMDEIPVKTGGLKVDVSRFAAGAYFLRITDKSGVVHGESKIIKSL